MAVSERLTVQLEDKYPMLRYLTDRTFGVEIEFYGLDYVLIPMDAGMIKPYNISSKTKDGRRFKQLCNDSELTIGNGTDSWHFEEDTSVRGLGHTKYGAELVSPILTGLEGLVQVYHAFQFLNEIKGVDIDASCGFHVHHGVDRKFFGCEQIRQLVRIVHPMESLFYLLIPGDRQNAKTCRPMEIDVKSFLQTCEPECGPRECHIKKLWYSPENRFDPEEARFPRFDRTRYHGLNLHSYWYRSTIEFRYHSAILQYIDEAMQWIIFSQFLVELSQGNVPNITIYPDGNKWMRTIYVIYDALGYSDRIMTVAS